jgi:hypothetical protein
MGKERLAMVDSPKISNKFLNLSEVNYRDRVLRPRQMLGLRPQTGGPLTQMGTPEWMAIRQEENRIKRLQNPELYDAEQQEFDDMIEEELEKKSKLDKKHEKKRAELERKKIKYFGRKTKKAFQSFARSKAGKLALGAAKKVMGPAGVALTAYDMYKAGIFDDTNLEDKTFGGKNVGFAKGGRVRKKKYAKGGKIRKKRSWNY